MDRLPAHRKTKTNIARAERRGGTPGHGDNTNRSGVFQAPPAKNRQKYRQLALPSRSDDKRRTMLPPDAERRRSGGTWDCARRSNVGIAHRISSWEKIRRADFPV